jgi:hypothetical protein
MALKWNVPFAERAGSGASAIERVGAEVEVESGVLLGDGASAEMLGLFEQGDFSARLGESIGGGEPGESSADDDIGLHSVSCW